MEISENQKVQDDQSLFVLKCIQLLFRNYCKCSPEQQYVHQTNSSFEGIKWNNRETHRKLELSKIENTKTVLSGNQGM